MKKNCLNCHFFCKEHHDPNGETNVFMLNDKERKVFEADPVGQDRGWESLKCYMGVWDEGVSPVAEPEDKILFSQDRGHNCFFIPYRKSMLLPAAAELQKRSEANRQLRTSHKLTIIGLWIAAIGLILNAIIAKTISNDQLSVMEKQSLIAERQFQSGIDPSISIELIDLGVGKNGIYSLKIKNDGTLDIRDVAIYENYLTCPFEQKGSHLAIDSKSFSISGISTLPMKKVPLLKPGDEIPYTIDIKKHIAETTEGTLYPCFLRLRVDNRKKVDGKPYQKLSAYGISNILFDLESEGSRAMLGNQQHIARVRELLLNNF